MGQAEKCNAVGPLRKLAIITTHPIQYNAPIFRMLSERGKIDVKVFYTWSQSEREKKFDPGFGKVVQWDIPLLEGYKYSFSSNISKAPGSHHFKGIINPSLIKEIEDWGATAVMVFGWSFQSHLQCIRYFYKRVPVFFRGDSTLIRKQSTLKRTLRTYFLKWVYHYVNTAFYVGSENKKYFIKHGLKEGELEFAPHAVDNNRFFDEEVQYVNAARDWRAKLNVSDTDLVCVYAGKLDVIKNPLFIVELAKKARDMAVRFLIVGNGPLEATMKAEAGDLPNVTFLDFQNQSKMPVVYRLGEVFLLASVSETWGLAVNEAMACGRIILVNNHVGCAVDLVKHGKNGFIYNAGDVDEALRYLEFLLNKPEQVPEMAAASRKMIEDWSYEKVCAAIEKRMLLQ